MNDDTNSWKQLASSQHMGIGVYNSEVPLTFVDRIKKSYLTPKLNYTFKTASEYSINFDAIARDMYTEMKDFVFVHLTEKMKASARIKELKGDIKDADADIDGCSMAEYNRLTHELNLEISKDAIRRKGKPNTKPAASFVLLSPELCDKITQLELETEYLTRENKAVLRSGAVCYKIDINDSSKIRDWIKKVKLHPWPSSRGIFVTVTE